MDRLSLHDLHQQLGARFTAVTDCEAVADYGNFLAEHRFLRESAGVLDLSFRSRVCLTGADRVRFLHGQVTNEIKRLQPGEGCYTALVSAKGRMESDLNVYCLEGELLLDFEPGLRETVTGRLERYIVADDVEVVDVGALFGLLSLQGPNAKAVAGSLGLFSQVPEQPFHFSKADDANLGELYLVNHARLGSAGFDLFAPMPAMGPLAERLIAAAKTVSGGPSGWQAFETARIERGIPRFGPDMDERNFPQECGIEAQAVSYTKGCYIGQEVLNRIYTLGHVNRGLCGLRLGADTALPAHGDKLFHAGKEVGYLTSAVWSPALEANIALGYARNEARQAGTELIVRGDAGESAARVVSLPFVA
ncbi:MAG TPA: glycine cleavage T C-terminal barrel domain-containing protein [Verrucomicrobiae bacterium]|nr:glycine cleavage T C-terminal barrel domain-containing protein [Verrucomicrobiae bacterium]